jgi:hypothetical protein
MSEIKISGVSPDNVPALGQASPHEDFGRESNPERNCQPRIDEGNQNEKTQWHEPPHPRD